MVTTRRVSLSLIVSLVVILALAACQSAPPAPSPAPLRPTAAPAPAAPTSAPPPAAPTAVPAPAKPTAVPEKQTLRLRYGVGAIPPTLGVLPVLAAQYKGFFDQEKLDFNYIGFIGDAIATRALAAGEVDAILVGLTVVFPQIEQGAKFKAIGSITPGVDYQVVASKNKVPTFADLSKAIIGISSPGAASQLQIQGVMAKRGLDPSKGQYVAVGSDSQRQQALVAGKIDATLLHAPRALYMTRTSPNDFHVLASVAKEVPEAVGTMSVASDSAIQQKTEALDRYVRAIIRANRWIMENPKDAAEVGLNFIPDIDKDDMASSLNALVEAKGFFGHVGTLDRKIFEAQMKDMVDAKSLKAMLPLDKVMDTQFVDRALKELGPSKFQ